MSFSQLDHGDPRFFMRAVPLESLLGVPAADLVFIQSGQSLARLEVFRGLPDPGDLDQCGERDAARAVAPVERQFHGAAVAADQ